MTTLIFIRHASAKSGAKVDELFPSGFEEARVFGKRLTEIYADFCSSSVRVLSSPTNRTIDTAKCLIEGAGREGVDVEQSDLLKSRDFGVMQGLNAFLPRDVTYAVCVSHEPIVANVYEENNWRGVMLDQTFERPMGFSWKDSSWRPENF